MTVWLDEDIIVDLKILAANQKTYVQAIVAKFLREGIAATKRQ